MSLVKYLEAEPLHEIDKYRGGSHANSVAFVGVLRKHPYDEEKLLLFADPSSREAVIMEFRRQDVVCVEDLPAPITERGESYLLLRLWVAKGSIGMKYEPFEVDEPLRHPGDSAFRCEKPSVHRLSP